VTARRGTVNVNKVGKRLPWTSAAVSKIPNYSVFDALVRAVLAPRP